MSDICCAFGINWCVRFHNPVWWAQLGLAIASPVLAYHGLSFKDMSSWKALGKVTIDALSNPYILGLIVINVFNTINDPTTKGLSDSVRALGYDVPK